MLAVFFAALQEAGQALGNCRVVLPRVRLGLVRGEDPESHAACKLDNCGVRPRSRSCCARLRRSWAWTYASCGAPSTARPCWSGGSDQSPTHAGSDEPAAPGSAMEGSSSPAAFHMRVLPACNLTRACSHRAADSLFFLLLPVRVKLRSYKDMGQVAGKALALRSRTTGIYISTLNISMYSAFLSFQRSTSHAASIQLT